MNIVKDKMKKENRYALILAGGNGTRLFPISTTNKPKQYLNLYEDNSMINATINRIKPIFDDKNIFVIINESQRNLADRYIDYDIPRENIICEPMVKGEFEWMDIGSINDFFKTKSKNIRNNIEIGKVITQDTKETNLYNENESYLVATIGVENLNIINCNGVILIANKNKMDKLPELIEKIKENEEYKKYL